MHTYFELATGYWPCFASAIAILSWSVIAPPPALAPDAVPAPAFSAAVARRGVRGSVLPWAVLRARRGEALPAEALPAEAHCNVSLKLTWIVHCLVVRVLFVMCVVCVSLVLLRQRLHRRHIVRTRAVCGTKPLVQAVSGCARLAEASHKESSSVAWDLVCARRKRQEGSDAVRGSTCVDEKPQEQAQVL